MASTPARRSPSTSRPGEVLALASKPDYDLNDFSPHISKDTYAAVEKSGGWINRAIQGLYPPGSTFKILTSVAGMRLAGLSDTDFTTECEGSMMIGNRRFNCDTAWPSRRRKSGRGHCHQLRYLLLELGPAHRTAPHGERGPGDSI